MILVDGFTIDAPDTSANQAVYPQKPAQAEGLGFPMLRCVALISMTTGLLIDLAYAAYSGKGSGETALLRKLKESLRRGDHPVGAKQINDRERTVAWLRPARPDWMGKSEYRKVPKTVEIRLIDVHSDPSVTRSGGFTIATTMQDNVLQPSCWIGSLYKSRWMVEPDIRSIKVTMGLEHLRSLTPEGIERELWTGVLTYNLVRTKMLQSGFEAKREVRSLSFTETYQLLSTNWLLCACQVPNEAMVISAQLQGVCAIVGTRPERTEPRANKRRPKILKLMTIPRRLFKALISRLKKIP